MVIGFEHNYSTKNAWSARRGFDVKNFASPTNVRKGIQKAELCSAANVDLSKVSGTDLEMRTRFSRQRNKRRE
jgi:hypothetical protein